MGSSMRIRRTLPLCVAAVLAVAAATPAAASAACAGETLPVASADAGALRAAVACLTNEARTDRGLAPLQVDPRLQDAAQAHADDMRAKSYFAHQAPLGPGLGTRISARGYRWSAIAENIALGQETPYEVVQAWLASSGHCTNILGPYDDIGVGLTTAGHWVQDFGVQMGDAAPAGGGSCPTSLGRDARPDTSTTGGAAGPAPSAPPGGGPPPAPGSATTGTLLLGRLVGLPAGRGLGRGVRVRVSCPAGGPACPGTLRVRAGRRALARRSVAVPAGRSRSVTLRLDAMGERALRASRSLTVRVEVRAGGTLLSRRVRLPARR